VAEPAGMGGSGAKQNHLSGNLLKDFNYFVLIVVFMLSACGLEEDYSLYQVPQGNIRVVFCNTATITLPSVVPPSVVPSPSDSLARGYTIFYRIYISGVEYSGTISSQSYSALNPSLSSDYNSINPYTDPTTTTNANIGRLFANRNYYKLFLYNEASQTDDKVNDARTVLLKSGGTAVIDFPSVSGEDPTLKFNSQSYLLYRSNGEGDFNPVPDRYFFNSDAIKNNDNATSTKNADVAANTSATSTSEHYTYVSMYIAMTGFDDRTFTTFYGKPTHIGVFRLTQSGP
jgi:hypothetical protein